MNTSSLQRGIGAVRVGLTLLLAFGTSAARGQLTLANPHWNITLTDAGYSDFLLDNTPGFEGREYLSGEWGAAVGYQVAGSPAVTPQWLEPQFLFPDWNTLSPFAVASPITQTGVNADGLPIAQSVIANGEIEITLHHEMVDTVVGTPMGVQPASAGGAGAAISSDRYVLKQTCTIKNVSGSTITNLQFFQFLHGLNAQRGVYDNRLHAGALSAFRYDVTEAGVDAWAATPASSSAGVEDFIGFHAAAAPDAFEIGHYGIEGNGVDDHAFGKPSDGVHRSIEDNWHTVPYSTRQGTDDFSPAQRWIGGAARWSLGDLAAGQSVGFDLLLTLRSGTRVPTGNGSSGGCNGGSGVTGGFNYEFDDVVSEGSCFGEYAQADDSEIAVRIAEGEFDPFTFLTPGHPAQVWRASFSGAFAGSVHLTFAYDATLLPAGFDESTLCIYQFNGTAWELLAGTVDPVLHRIAVTTSTLTTFALGVDGGVTYTLSATVDPANSGTIAGAGTYADGSGVSLVAQAAAGYAFVNWTEGGVGVSSSPAYTFLVGADRTLVAHFVAVDGAHAISTAALPSNGGSTSGDGAYAPGSSATVVATPHPGYKFSKWLVNGVSVSTSRTNTFTVTGDRALVAKFKPVYSVAVTAEPAQGGDVEADPLYEVGELAKLKAKPNPGYCFVSWTQNGTPVSTKSNYEFNVTANRQLVGHFALGHRIDVSAEPVNGGQTTGGGVYDAGAETIVEAIANEGYVFEQWTEGGVPVSALPTFSFTSATNRSLVAWFIAQPGVRSVLPAPEGVTVSWPAGANGWILQECTDLSLGDWVNATATVTVVGADKSVVVPPEAERRHFRLIHP